MRGPARRWSAVLLIVTLSLITSRECRAQNPIQLENAKAGTPNWQLTNPATNQEIEGYASLTSVNRGGQISFYVNTADSMFTLEIFRMGWYGGAGARLVTPAVQLDGTVQPVPTADATTGIVECNWSNPYTITIPDDDDPTDWASGVYLARLTGNTTGKQSYIIFVVRDDSRSSTYLFQLSTNTFQAYNNWGGKSLYAWNSTNQIPAVNVSYNRPYALGNQASSVSGVGAGEFLTNLGPASETTPGGWTYNMVRFLEREGYDVAYITDVDAHENSSLLLSHKALLVVGHSEYWSWQMRTNVQAARDAGVSLGFFSSDTCYWQIRFAASTITGAADRTIICYKSATTDPDASNPNMSYLTTVLWRSPPVNMPEEALVGVMYETDPVYADIVVSNASNWVYANTDLQNGSHLAGLLGYEVDAMQGNQPADTVGVAHETTSNGAPADTTVYTAASGAIVFATGSMDWSWGLDDYNAPAIRPSVINPTAQQITRNVLAQLAGQPLSPSFSMIPSPRVLSVSWGDSVSFTVTAAAFGYSPTISLSLSGLPANVPYSFSPATLHGSGSSTLTISPTTQSSTGTCVLTITATDGTQTRTEAVTLNVFETLLSISVAPNNPVTTVGGTQQFVATGNYEEGSVENLTSQVIWTSLNSGVATVNATGLVSSLGPGSSNIEASLSGISDGTTLTAETPLTIRYVQSTGTYSTTSATSASKSFSQNTTAGDTIIVAVSVGGTGIASVTDTQQNTYVQAVAPEIEGESEGDAIWYATNIRGGADTVTANFDASTTWSTLYIHEYSGVATSSPVDQVATLGGNGESPNSGALTTTQENELIFGFAVVGHFVSAPGTGFTARQTAGGNMSEDEIVSATGSYSATFTQNTNGSDLQWLALLATFKAGPSGSSPTLQSISVTPANPSIAINGSLQLTATGTYSDSSNQNVTSFCAWTSSTTGVATVSSSGQVSGLALGSATIKCTIGSIVGSTTVTVTANSAIIRNVQSAGTQSGQSTSAISESFSSDTTAGDTIIVAIDGESSSITSVTDSLGNTYTKAAGIISPSNLAIYYTSDVNGGADTVTANFSSSTGFSTLYIHELSGLVAGSPVDQINSSSVSSGTSLTSGNVTTTQPSELLFGYCWSAHSVTAGEIGWGVLQTAGGNLSQDLAVSSTGTYAAKCTQSASGSGAALIATFKAASGGPYVQSAGTYSLQNASAISESFSSNPTAGDTIIVAIDGESSSITSVTDSLGNTYTKAAGIISPSNLAIYYASDLNGGADTITAHFSSSTGFSTLYIHEFSGLLASSPVDQINSSSVSSGTSLTSGNVTTTQPSELLFGYCWSANSITAGESGWNVMQTTGGNLSQELPVSSTGTYAAKCTQSASGSGAALVATFKMAQ